jgi:adenylylsulfate kinase
MTPRKNTGAHPAQLGLTVWFTGLSSAGKSTLSRAVCDLLCDTGYDVEVLDGDLIRRELSKGLGFSKEDRDENIRRIGFVADLLSRHGVIVLVSAISPYRAIRDEIRSRIGRFVEVHVDAPLAVCEERDVKGLYRKARSGELRQFTGIDDPYEPPLNPEVVCHTDRETVEQSAEKVFASIRRYLGQSGCC